MRIEDLPVLTPTDCLELLLEIYRFTIPQILHWSDDVMLSDAIFAHNWQKLEKKKKKKKNNWLTTTYFLRIPGKRLITSSLRYALASNYQKYETVYFFEVLTTVTKNTILHVASTASESASGDWKDWFEF